MFKPIKQSIMKSKLTLMAMLFAAVLSISSCSPKVYGLRGNYEVTKNIETSSSFDDVWNRVIDFFAESNIPIATLEKASGIIVASHVNIENTLVSVENEQGEISDKNAWFVFPYEKNLIGGRVECSFNVRVRKQENGKTYISVNLGGITGYKSIEFLNALTFRKEFINQTVPSTCYSTGKFEQDLLNLFK